MSKGFQLLRLEYIFTVIIPILFAIYLNNYNILNNLDIIFAFAFWAITGNSLNDLKDMDNLKDKETAERTKGYSKKEIGVVSITGFILGTTLFLNPILNHPEISFYLIAIVIFVVL